MHEYAITKELFRVAREAAQKNNMKNIREIVVELGNLSGYVAESIQYYFEELKQSRDTLHKAQLKFKEVNGTDINIKSIKGE